MTDADRAQLVRRVAEWRARAAPVGPQHSLWDLIFDAEAILAGRGSILSEAEILDEINKPQ